MRRRAATVVSSLLAVLALAAAGWLLDPVGPRVPAELDRPHAAPPRTVSGSALYDAVTRRMRAAQTATYTFSGSAGGGEVRSGSGRLRFVGSVPAARSFDADVTVRSDSTGVLRAVLLPNVAYLALPPAKGIPRRKPWLKVSGSPRTPLGRVLRPVAQQLRAAVDPGETLAVLRVARRVQVLGPDPVEGVPATRHRALVGLRRSVTAVTDPTVAAAYRTMLAAGVRTLRFELWLDRSGLPLRLRTDVPRTPSVYSMTGVFRGWGAPLRIVAPTPAQVFDADRIKGSAASPAP